MSIILLRTYAVAIAALAITATTVMDSHATAQRRPTFASDVAEIVHTNCAVCHRPDSAAPFSLLSYDEVRAHGKEIVAAVTSRRMPPWAANSTNGFLPLQHSRRLSPGQIATLTAWVENGMPSGDLLRTPLPPPFPARWLLGLPDLTLSLPRPFSIPASTSDRLFNVVLHMDFLADRWITAIDYRPTARAVLSHAVVFAAPAKTAIGDDDPLPGFAGLMGPGAPAGLGEELLAVDRSLETLGVWTPAGRPWPTPAGSAIRLPRGSNIVMQFHARASDTGAVEDGTLAIYFAKERPAASLASLQVPPSFGVAAGIDIAAGAPRVVVKDEFTLPVDVVAFGARGHGHDLARDMKMTVRLPGGSSRNLLWLDRWDVDKQETYYFESPVRLPKGSVVRVELTYDNSQPRPGTPPVPPRRVTWGTRLSDEIGSMALVIAEPATPDAAVLAAARAAHFRDQLLRSIRKTP